MRLEVNQTVRVDFPLDVGSVTETVQVTEAVPLIDADTSAIGQVIETKAIEDLPLNGRNFVQLAILGPGVSGVGFGSRGTIMSGTRPDDLRPGSEIFANGNREGSNNFLYDGADNNDRLTLSITLRPSVEAVREFKIQTNMFAADQGRNAGATVNVISKSGSNEWHGSAYEFLRNDALDARNFFARPDQEKPAFRQNQFGASFGGRVIPNKLFFFGNYEGFRRRLENTSVNTVPTLAMRQGDFSGVRDIFNPFSTVPDASAPSRFSRSPFPNRQIPQSLWDPVTRKLINAYPLPESAGLVNNQVTNPKDKQKWDQGDLRMDWNLSEKNVFFGRFSRQDTVTTRPATFAPVTIDGISTPVSLGSEASFAGDSALKTYNSVLTWIRTLTPSFFMEARMGFNRFNLLFLQEGATEGARLGEQLGVLNSNQGPRSDGIPIFSPSGYQGIGQTRSLPIIRIQDTFHPNVNFTNLRGAHSLKFGFESRRRRVTQFQTNRGNGRFNFARTFSDNPNQTGTTGDPMASFLLGTASVIEQDFTLVTPGIRMTEWGMFVQDDWKVSERLTVNIGLRYEYDTPPYEIHDDWTNFDPFTGTLLIAGFNTDRRTGVQPDRNNFAPRLGFAYRVRPGTVVRGGYGIFYNPAGSESVLLRRHRQLPFGPINVEDINQFSPTPRRVQDGLRPIPVLDPNIVATNPEGAMLAVTPFLRSGYAQQMNLQVQQQLPMTFVAKVGYVGNVGRKLDTTYDFNQPVPGAGAPGPRRPLATIAPRVVGVNYNVSDGKAAYHSLQATLERRFQNGLGFLGAYTWAHSIDDVANAFGGADNGPIPQDRRCRQCDRGTSGFDIRHRFTYSMNYALPFGKGRRYSAGSAVANAVFGGWDTNLIFTTQTGLPFTPVLQTSVSNAGGSRPDTLRKVNEVDNRGPQRWFDTSFNTADAAWGIPQQFTFGNAGRNVLTGPGRTNIDFSVFKDFSPSERWKLQFRGEFFNLFNTPQFNQPNATIGSPAAGTITSIVGNPRQVQLGLRLAF
ncbi:MAG: TonB-dependent receptor [Bryobacterales bacterium]|nr:TonB-dependent receptor [Bryobacterales bacterium]